MAPLKPNAARARVLRPASDARFALGMMLAVALPALAGWIDSFADWRLPTIPFTLAVVGAALVGRLLAGLTAAVLSTVLVGYLVLDANHRALLDAVTVVSLLGFLTLALVVSWILARADAVAEQRRDAGASLALAVRAGRLGTWRWDARTNEVVWDTEMERVYGIAPGSFDGRYESYIALQHLDDREEVRATVERAVANKTGYRVVHRTTSPTGAVRWIEGFAEPLLGERGEVVGLTGVARDITQERTQQLERDRALTELDHLLSITDVTLSAFEFDELVDRVTERVTEILEADVTTLLLLTPDGRYLEQARGIGEPIRIAVGAGVAGRIVAEREPMIIPDVSTYQTARPWLRGMTSFLGVPIEADGGRVLGVLHVTTKTHREFTEGDRQLLSLAAGRLATSLERTRLYADREQTSRVLQQSILPGELPDIPGLDLGGLYIPYAPGEDVGGDFFDAFPLADGSFLLAIGDVSGKGAAAAAVMGFVRHSLRSIARFVTDPGELVRELNRAMLEDSPTPGERFCTVVIVRVEPGEERAHLTVARGGHEMPLVARSDGAVEQIAEGGPPIGMWADLDVTERELDLGNGDALVLFTDGLVETPDSEHRDELARVLKDLTGATAPEIVEALRSRMITATSTSYDDVAVLVVTKR
jgi:PAS domain S-box-containing protein